MPHRARRLILECHEQTIWESKGRDHSVLPPTIFFFLTLHLFAIVRMLMLQGSGITVSTPLQVTVAALILGKAVLIADMLPFINLYPHKPLIYNVAWKPAILLSIRGACLLHGAPYRLLERDR